jgi:hypothetical protein
MDGTKAVKTYLLRQLLTFEMTWPLLTSSASQQQRLVTIDRARRLRKYLPMNITQKDLIFDYTKELSLILHLLSLPIVPPAQWVRALRNSAWPDAASNIAK